MMKLEEKKWKPFELRTILCSINSKPYHSNSLTFTEGNGVPYITRTAKNNGVYGFVVDDGSFNINPCNTISYGAETVEFFYHTISYITGNKMYYLKSQNINKFTGLFFITCLYKNIKECFSYANGAIPERVMRKSIMLPITDTGEPDYQFMEDYIHEMIASKKKQYRRYVKNRLAKLNAVTDNQKIYQKSLIDNHKWKPFQIDSIFNIMPGKRLVAADSTPGNRPFIGALDNSNGIARFVDDKNESLDKNVLGVNYNGNGMVIGFYHPYECIFSDDVKRFHLKNWKDDSFVLLFMKSAIFMQKQKFGYLYKFNADRMAHTNIMLPITDAGQPDYAYMEQYAKNMMLRKYQQYLSHIEAQEK